MIKKLPCIILCILVLAACRNPWESRGKDPQETGNPARNAAALNVYYGILHNHSNYSDGTGSPANAYTYARDTAHLDFFGLADHAERVTASEWTALKATADRFNQDGVFATFSGFEWSHSTYGHVTVIGSKDICNAGQSAANTFPKLVEWLNSREALAFFNHPGRQDATGAEFNHFTSAVTDKFAGMELWNKNDGFDVYYYNQGYYTNDGNKGFFDEALARGWKIGASGSDDNHNGTFGTGNDYRMAVIAASLTRSNIYNAIKARAFYSTGDKNMKLSFFMNGSQMGSTAAPGAVSLEISAYDTENFTQVELLKNGSIIRTWAVNSTNPVLTLQLAAADGENYYARVKQSDGDEAISSPIHIRGVSSLPAASSTAVPAATGLQ